MSIGRTIAGLKTFVVLVVLLVVLLAGWAVWQQIHSSGIIDSYQACVDAGNPIQESYPTVCMDKDGNRFVNPDQRVQ